MDNDFYMHYMLTYIALQPLDDFCKYISFFLVYFYHFYRISQNRHSQRKSDESFC